MPKHFSLESDHRLYGLLLSGGKSTRMQQDKSLLIYHGRTQVEYGYELLRPYCANVFISNREDQADLPGHKTLLQIHDHADYAGIGPLAGILSAMHQYPEVAWLVLACDLPYVTTRTIEDLIGKRNPALMATAYISATDGLPEPLCAIYEPRSRSVILNFLKEGIQCPRKIMIQSNNVALIQPVDKGALDNINSPQEYKEALRKLKQKHHG